MQIFTRKRSQGVIIPCLFFILFFIGEKIYPAELSLTLEDAINRAVANSISLQKSAIDLELAQYRNEHIWAELFPTISLSGSLNVLPSTPLFTDPGFTYDNNRFSYSVGLDISLRLNPRISYSMKLTELAYQRGLLDFESASREVALIITKNFYSLLASKENLKNIEENLALAESQLEKNEIARANGLIGELPLLRSRLDVENARYNLSNAQGTYLSSLHVFLTTLGLDRDVDVILVGSIEPVAVTLDPEALILEFLPRRPDIVRMRQTIEQRELELKQNNMSSKAPTLSLSAGWSGSANPLADPPSRAGSADARRFTDNLSARLSLSIPIDPWIPGTSTNQSLRSSDATLEKARLDLIEAENNAKTSIRSYAERINNSWKSIEIARLSVEIAQRTYELTEIGFQNGVVEYLTYENTRNNLANAQYQLLQSELTYYNNLLDLASSLNVDLETLIRRGN